MGKSSKIKQRTAQAEEEAFRQRFAELSRQAAFVPPPPPLLAEFRAYSAHFVRDPAQFILRTRSSDRGKQALEMARYLFGRFRVPRILDQAWSTYVADPVRPGANRGLPPRLPPANPNLRIVDFRAWFVCVATGGSLYKLHTRALLTKRETHEFLASPGCLDLCQAMIHAVARAAGAPPGDAQRLARSKLATQPFGQFWFDCVRFFCMPAHLPASVAQVNDLVDYLANRFAADRQFRLLGASTTLSALLRRMEQWHRELARAKDLSGIQWEGVALPDHTIELKDPEDNERRITWRFHQIVTGKELAAEGTAQRHCVYGYKQRCIAGACSIWSLSRIDAFGRSVRRLTIEVDGGGRIVQKRGLANRLPRTEEEHVVSLWARAMGLANNTRG